MMYHPFEYDDNSSFIQRRSRRPQYSHDRQQYLEMKARQQQREEEEAAARAAYARKLHLQRQRELKQREIYEQQQREQQYVQLIRQRREKQLARAAAAAEEEKRRRQRGEAEAAWRANNDRSDNKEDTDEPEFQIVLGRDGQLYYVKNPAYRPPRDNHNDDDEEFGSDGRLHTVRKTEKESSKHSCYNGMETDDEDDMDVVKKQSKSNATSKKKKNKRKGFNKIWNSLQRMEISDEMDTDDESFVSDSFVSDIVKDVIETNNTSSSDDDTSTNNNIVSTSQKKLPEKKKSNRKRVTIIVEDASDSEYDDDDYNSPWRNRRPSPGQWIEPVENSA